MDMELDSTLSPPKKRERPLSDLALTLTLTLTPSPPNQTQSTLKPEDRGIRLIQLLLTCAAHASAGNLHRADACLRLISTLSSPSGDSMQRLSARFAASLAARLLRRRLPGLLSALHRPSSAASSDPHPRLAFARALPYLPAAHAAVARTLLRALAVERVVHVIDLGASPSSSDLWAPLIRTFSCLPGGPPHLKLTCVSPDPHVLETLGSNLVKEAESLDVPFQFHPVNSALADLDSDQLRVKTGEALAVVSMLSLHELLAESDEEDSADPVKPHRQCRRMDGFLSMLRKMSPKVVMVMEQDSDHNSGRMVDRFVESLHYYSAVFDSVESAILSGWVGAEERVGVEEMVGREIENVVGCEGVERVERHERVEKWVGRMERAGFRQARVWYDAVEEARRVVESWPGVGYGVVTDKGCLMICWHDRPLYAVSAWLS